MAPLGMVDMLGQFSSPEVGIISLIVFFILSITLVALCGSCRRSSGKGYDVSDSTTAGAGGTNGTAVAMSGGTADQGSMNWRSHKNMPPSTLERSQALTN